MSAADARPIARRLLRFPGADALVRDAVLGRITPDVAAAGLLAGLDGAWRQLDHAELHGRLFHRFVQPRMAGAVTSLPTAAWPAVYERLAAAVREDARAAFEAGARAAITDLAPRLPFASEPREHAAILARLDAAPLDPDGVAEAVTSTPTLDAALAACLAAPPPTPQDPPPPPRDGPRPRDLLGALGKALELVGALARAATGSRPPEPAITTLGTVDGPVVALAVVGDAVLARAAAGAVRAWPRAGGPGTGATWPEADAPDLDRWPPTPGPVRGWCWLGGDALAVVGAHDGGGGFVAWGKPGTTWEAFDGDDEETVFHAVCAHPEGVLVGAEDGSVRLYDPELATGLDLDAPVRAVAFADGVVFAGLADGRVVRVPFP